MNLKRQLFLKIEDAVVNPNCGKYLSSRPEQFAWCNKRQKYFRRKTTSARKFYMHMRCRTPERNYYLVTLKGNYIRGYKIQYIRDNKPINTYMDVTIPTLLGQDVEEPVKVKTLIAKQPFKKWKDFVVEFRNNSPSLEWLDREKPNE